MPWKFLFVAALVVCLLTGCAVVDVRGVNSLAAKDLQECLEGNTPAGKGCVLMTPGHLQRFYDHAYQAGRAYEKGKKDAITEQEEELMPAWQKPGYQRGSI